MRVYAATALVALGLAAPAAADDVPTTPTTTAPPPATTTAPAPPPPTTTAPTTTAPAPPTTSTTVPAPPTTTAPAAAPPPPTTSTTAPAPTTTAARQPRISVPAQVSGEYELPEVPEIVPVPAQIEGKLRTLGLPLQVTPPLNGGAYVFPVAGETSWGDSYGGERSDVAGGWHHGDDIFGKLGQPVLAVADGRIYKIGWQRIGGWRFWLRDREGNRFYYAHLSGFTPLAQEQAEVKAGDVIGYIGHTGDAFTTPFHLHFEIHPVSLLWMNYNGAVNPTSYLATWRHETKPAPPPAPLPEGAAEHGEGAVSDYRQLLSLFRKPGKKQTAGAASEEVRAEAPARTTTTRLAAAPASPGSPQWWIGAVAGGGAILFASGVELVRRRRLRPPADEA